MIKKAMFRLLKIGFTTLHKIGSISVTQNRFHKRYSFICAYVCMHACMYVMYAFYVCICIAVQIGSKSVTQNRSTNVIQNWSTSVTEN